jgi:hypothetical protein
VVSTSNPTAAFSAFQTGPLLLYSSNYSVYPKDAVKEWLNGLAAEVYDEETQKLVTRYDKCLNVGGVYVEK